MVTAHPAGLLRALGWPVVARLPSDKALLTGKDRCQTPAEPRDLAALAAYDGHVVLRSGAARAEPRASAVGVSTLRCQPRGHRSLACQPTIMSPPRGPSGRSDGG